MDPGTETPGYEAFFAALIEGRLKLGQTLKQEELADILGVSLSPMREITTLLEWEGLVTVRRRIGITIFSPDVKFVGNTFQFRGLLEKEGLRKFARQVTPEWIAVQRAAHADTIRHVTEVHEQHLYRVRVRETEAGFHRTFIDALENDQVSVTYARLSQKMYLIRLHNLVAVDEPATVQSMLEHLAVVDALEHRDVEAAIEALDKHLKGVLHRILTT